MNIRQIKEVMKRYGIAWEKQDSSLIIDCFTKNGIYQESPLAKPYRGHKEIKRFWDKTVKNETTNINFSIRKCYVATDGKTGFAEWICKNIYKGEKQHMVGIMIIKMKGNKISFLNEYWNTKV